MGQPTSALWLDRIVDDSEVRLYTIATDGFVCVRRVQRPGPRVDPRDEGGDEINDTE